MSYIVLLHEVPCDVPGMRGTHMSAEHTGPLVFNGDR